MLVDIVGKRNKVRNVPMLSWTKQAIDEYASAAGLTEGIVFCPVNKGGRIAHDGMSEQGIYNLVIEYAHSLRLSKLAPHDLRRTFANLLRKE